MKKNVQEWFELIRSAAEMTCWLWITFVIVACFLLPVFFPDVTGHLAGEIVKAFKEVVQ